MPLEPVTVDADLYSIEGSAEAGSLVTVYLDANNNDEVDGNDAPVGQQKLTEGTTAYAVQVSLAQNADNDFVVTATDAAGNVSAAADVPTITEDSPPPAPVIAGIIDDTGEGDNDGITNDQRLEFTGTAEADALVELFRDDVSVGTTPADGSGAWIFDYTAVALDDRTYQFTARARDAGGNESDPSVPFTVVVDTTRPTAMIDVADGQADPADESPVNFTVSFSEPVIGFEAYDVTLGGTAGAAIAVVSNPSGDQRTYNVAVSGMTRSGTVVLGVGEAGAYDSAGNTNSASSADVTLTYVLVQDPNLLVTTATDIVDENDGVTSLREAIQYAEVHDGDHTITFDGSLAGQTIALTDGELAITDAGTTTVAGLGADLLTISGGNTSRVFSIDSDAMVAISGLKITRGHTTANGGGIYNSGVLAVTQCSFTDNVSTEVGGGGGIANTGDLTVVSSTFIGNEGDQGGGIGNTGMLTIANSTFFQNTASQYGGGIANDGTLTITGSTFTANLATQGGGILNFEAAIMTNCTLSGNVVSGLGGGIGNAGTLTATNTTVCSNVAVGGGGGRLQWRRVRCHHHLVQHDRGREWRQHRFARHRRHRHGQLLSDRRHHRHGVWRGFRR